MANFTLYIFLNKIYFCIFYKKFKLYDRAVDVKWYFVQIEKWENLYYEIQPLNQIK